MFESCLRNYSSLLWAAFFVEPEHRPCSRSQFFDLKVQSGKAERESCLRNKEAQVTDLGFVFFAGCSPPSEGMGDVKNESASSHPTARAFK